MTVVPAKSVPFDLIQEFIDQLGFDVRDVASVLIVSRRIEVTQYRYDHTGARFPAGNRAATIRVDIAVEDPDAGV